MASPVARVDAALRRIERVNSSQHIYLSVFEQEARAAAQKAAEDIKGGARHGPLFGLPYSAKDLFAVRGHRRTCGTRVAVDAPDVEAVDATAIARLREAGAILLGKTNLHEVGSGATGINPHFGSPSNPFDASRIAGGSSSGSAVDVAYSISEFSLGTDTGGSVRIPAALCGIVGFKPSFGRVSRDGAFPLSRSLDHVGVLAREVRTIREVAQCIGDFPPEGPTPRSPGAALRAAVLADDLAAADAGVAQGFASALEVLRGLGIQTVTVDGPWSRQASAICAVISGAESGALHRKWLAQHRSNYGDDVRRRLLAGALLPEALYAKALELREELARRFATTWQAADIVVTPTVPIVAPRRDQCTDEVAARLTANTRLFNLLGAPACSLPCPGSALPAGITIAAPAGEDLRVLDVAQRYEVASRAGWPIPGIT